MSDDMNYDQRRLVGKVVRTASNAIIDSIVDTHSAIIVLAITVTAEAGAIAMFLIAKDKVIDYIQESDDNVWMYGAVIAFAIAFFTMFGLLPFLPFGLRRRLSDFAIWPIAILAGVANIGLFYLLLGKM